MLLPSVSDDPNLCDESFDTRREEQGRVVSGVRVLQTEISFDRLDLPRWLVDEVLRSLEAAGIGLGGLVGLRSGLETLTTPVDDHGRVVQRLRERPMLRVHGGALLNR